ncbi:hypothetical protein [Mesorhizobium sp. CA7]|uniref:hypothetical protein n=1 Tax=Mesorhizobium sp. CA7 TaxID=588501 RepID=UPI001CCD8FE2|nr:hypothetical protein [Mesorhizobium sp. CA7]MBZ9815772.1 hypothetical protein [Mesorhizobium sp. CA7]
MINPVEGSAVISVTLSEVANYVSNHCKANDTPEQTLNRLFHKHLNGKALWNKNVPQLNSENTTVAVEYRSKQALAELANPNGECRDSDGPMVIASYLGSDYLLDGNHRGRAWKQSQAKGNHMTYIITVGDPGKVESDPDETTT